MDSLGLLGAAFGAVSAVVFVLGVRTRDRARQQKIFVVATALVLVMVALLIVSMFD
ncbi:hypothetical protein [Plantactinospora sonchi]|uniref:Uncharacterized protein n=1 Tax=Plantactinospora sonchi TaxID=1544735 RepID=A0ABU7RZB5_9ACTN